MVRVIITATEILRNSVITCTFITNIFFHNILTTSLRLSRSTLKSISSGDRRSYFNDLTACNDSEGVQLRRMFLKKVTHWKRAFLVLSPQAAFPPADTRLSYLTGPADCEIGPNLQRQFCQIFHGADPLCGGRCPLVIFAYDGRFVRERAPRRDGVPNRNDERTSHSTGAPHFGNPPILIIAASSDRPVEFFFP